jgi:hypothetical protein
VRAGLHREIERRASRPLAGGLESDHLSVRASLPLVPPLPDDLAVSDDDRADHRVRVGASSAVVSELESSFEAHARSTRAW